MLAEITKDQVIGALQQRGLKFKVGGRYILTQCPVHTDSNPSAQIYLDDFFINCHVCGRMSPYHAFPELKITTLRNEIKPMQQSKPTEEKYKSFDLMDYWQSLVPIPLGEFKGMPTDHLNDLGWRVNDGKVIAGEGWFIPYFSRSKTSIPFAQVRHLTGERRFTFLKDAKPTCYGTWNLFEGDSVFLVEGASDGAVLDWCQIPWITLPSASSSALVKPLAKWCKENRTQIIYAGDNDEAGDKLKSALDGEITYRIKQPPKRFKDYGEFFEVEGIEAVRKHCEGELWLI